jgi:hypothetical protein
VKIRQAVRSSSATPRSNKGETCADDEHDKSARNAQGVWNLIHASLSDDYASAWLKKKRAIKGAAANSRHQQADNECNRSQFSPPRFSKLRLSRILK